MSNLKDFIRTVPDFPIPGIQFRDITSLIEDPAGLNKAIVGLLHEASKFRTTVIVGVESRGFWITCSMGPRHTFCNGS
jgi:adenine phosphoribosyltransferase